MPAVANMYGKKVLTIAQDIRFSDAFLTSKDSIFPDDAGLSTKPFFADFALIAHSPEVIQATT
jgi:hypothetical protein